MRSDEDVYALCTYLHRGPRHMRERRFASRDSFIVRYYPRYEHCKDRAFNCRESISSNETVAQGDRAFSEVSPSSCTSITLEIAIETEVNIVREKRQILARISREFREILARYSRWLNHRIARIAFP